MKKKAIHWYNYLLSSLLWVLGFGMMGCTETGDEYGPEPVVEYGPPPVTELALDVNFKATLSYLLGEWAAEYEGWDDVQRRDVTIRRTLNLAPNGTYQNHIEGKMPEGSDKQDFFLFESEGGTYTYDPSRGVVTYTCQYDSVLNFRDQTFTRYEQKHYYDHMDGAYTEKVLFTVEKNGKREWVTNDTFLSPTSYNSSILEYRMNRHDGNYGKQKIQ